MLIAKMCNKCNRLYMNRDNCPGCGCDAYELIDLDPFLYQMEEILVGEELIDQ